MLGDFRLLLLLMVLLVVVVVVALVLLLVVVEMVLLQLVAAGVLSRSGLLTLFRSFCFPFDDAWGFKKEIKGYWINLRALRVSPHVLSASQRRSNFPAESITGGHELCSFSDYIQRSPKNALVIQALWSGFEPVTS